MAKPEPAGRERYSHFLEIPTRWMDNDVYGHVNNVVYYSYFDTVVNDFLIRQGVLDIDSGPVIGLVVETQCHYFKALSFPEHIHAGLGVSRIGNSSVRYEIALFRSNDEKAAAQGHFIHVYVDREQRRPVPLPQAFRTALDSLTPLDGPERQS